MTKIMILKIHYTDLNIIKKMEKDQVKKQGKVLENFLYLKVERNAE